jgi:hypothetical protein
MPQLVAMDVYDVDGRNAVVNNLLLRWDTSSLPGGATIDGAWLRLFVASRGLVGVADTLARVYEKTLDVAQASQYFGYELYNEERGVSRGSKAKGRKLI